MNPRSPRQPLSVPKPHVVNHSPTADEFASWCEHPVTRWVASAYEAGIQANIAAWRGMLDGGKTETLAMDRIELRTRADAYRAFLETNHADYLRLIDPKEWMKTYGEARN